MIINDSEKSIFGSIPDDWSTSRIKSLIVADFTGTWGKENPNGTPVLRSTNFQKNGYLNLNSIAKLSVPEKHLENKKIKMGDILLERSGGGPKQPVGRVCWCDKNVKNFTFSNFCQILRPLDDVSKKFFFYMLYYLHQSDKTLLYQNQTTGIRNLEYKFYLKIFVPKPSMPEQIKIAEILSTVDDAIEKTDAIIKETQQLKKGLMEKLFTEGIGHTRFKKTKIGKIPEAWNIVNLNELSQDGINNGVFNDPKTVGAGYRLINVKDMYSGSTINAEKLTFLNLHEKEFERNKVQYGDIFFTRSSLVLEGIGFCNIYLGLDNDITYDGHLMRVRPNKKKILPHYLSTYCISPIARKFLVSMGKTTTMTTLSQRDLGRLPVPVPSIREQEKIAEIRFDIEKKIENEQNYKLELEQLKKGLLQVLLTGKVRVKI